MTRIVALEEHYATPKLLEATGLDLSWCCASFRMSMAASSVLSMAWR